jgi:hypothetical protein
VFDLVLVHIFISLFEVAERSSKGLSHVVNYEFMIPLTSLRCSCLCQFVTAVVSYCHRR